MEAEAKLFWFRILDANLSQIKDCRDMLNCHKLKFSALLLGNPELTALL